MATIAAPPHSPHRRHSAPHSTAPAMATLAPPSPSPHRLHSAPHSTTPLAASFPSPHRHSAPTSPPRRVESIAASSPSPHRHHSAPTSPPRRVESIAASSPSPHRRHSAPHPTTRAMALPAASSPSPHRRHSAPDSTTPLAASSPSTDLHSAPTSPPRRVDAVRVYAVAGSSMDFITELGRARVSEDGAEAREEAKQPLGRAEQLGDVVLAFMSNGHLCGVATLLADAPGAGEVSESDDGDDEEEEEGEDVACGVATLLADAPWAGEVSESDDGDEEWEDDESDEDKYTNTSLVSCTEVKVEDESEDDDDNGWSDWEANDVEKQEIKSEPTYSLKIRVWPSCGYANIVLADEDSWISTTSYSFSWLSKIEVELMLEKLAHPSQNDMKVDVSQVVSNAVLLRSEYEGLMVNSPAVEMFVKLKLCPRLHHFNVQQILGKGAYANVRLCTAGNQTDYAIKIIKSTDNDQSEPREIAILSSLRSAHVVKFLQGWTESHISVDYEECSSVDMWSQCDDSGGSGEASSDVQPPRYVMIQMELCQWTLADYLSNESRDLDDEKSLEIFEEIIRSVQYIHGQNVIHRDIKPSNIFKGKDNKFKLGDFGQSCVQPRYIVSFKGTPNLGTLFYAAPELDDGERMSDKVDIYPLGIIYFDLFHIFKTAVDKDKEFMLFKKDDGSNIEWSADFYLFKQMIAFDPVKRPSVDVVLERISQLRSYVHRTEGIERDIGTLQQEEKKLVAEIKRTARTGNEQMDPAKQMKVMQEFQKQSAQMDMTNEMMSDSIDNILDCYQAEEETEDIPNQLSSAPKGRIAGKKVVADESSELDELEKRLAALKSP